MEKIATIIKDWFMGVDNIGWDLVRPLVLISIFGFIGFQGWSLFNGHPFEPMSFGTGVAAVLTLIVGDRFVGNRRNPSPTLSDREGE